MMMSDATLQAVHDAIAAHIEDVNEGDPNYLTEWMFVASAAVATDVKRTAYYVYDSGLSYHHALGLMTYGLDVTQIDFQTDEDD